MIVDIWVVVLFCSLSLLIGFELGSWKEGRAVAKAMSDLSDMHYKEVKTIVDKILDLRKERKGGE